MPPDSIVPLYKEDHAMKFSMDKNLTFDQAVEIMFEKLGDYKIMALASSVND